jgi:hypothetical protein
VLSQSLLVFVAVLDGSGFNLANEWEGRVGSNFELIQKVSMDTCLIFKLLVMDNCYIHGLPELCSNWM